MHLEVAAVIRGLHCWTPVKNGVLWWPELPPSAFVAFNLQKMTYPLFLCTTLYISGVVCAVKNIMDLQCLYWKGLYPVHALVSTKIFYRRVNIQKAFLQCGKAYESSRRWFWFNICHKFFNVCAIRALTQQMLSWVVFTLKKKTF